MSRKPINPGTVNLCRVLEVPPAHTFAERLRELREAAGITRYELAKRADLPKQTVYKLEQGDRDPSWATVQKLAEALSVDVSVFVVKPPDSPPPDPPAASPD